MGGRASRGATGTTRGRFVPCVSVMLRPPPGERVVGPLRRARGAYRAQALEPAPRSAPSGQHDAGIGEVAGDEVGERDASDPEADQILLREEGGLA